MAAVTGIDLSEAYTAFARGRSDDRRITFDTGDASALPYPDGAFDRVASMLVLNLVPDAMAVAAEMVRVTRTGGLLRRLVRRGWTVDGAVIARRPPRVEDR